MTHDIVYETMLCEKLVRVLQFYLSLHEADEVYNMIINEGVSIEDVEAKLKEYRDNSDKEE